MDILQVKQRINDYFLAVEPLAKIATSIVQTQPIVMRIKDDGMPEMIWQEGWSEEAKQMYIDVDRHIKYLKELYFGKNTGNWIYPQPWN